jgi:hypothetical protein
VRAVSLRIRIYIIAGVHSIVFRYLYLAKRKEDLSFDFTFRISYHLRDVYSNCMCCWNGATYKWKVHNGKIDSISFVVKFRCYEDDVLSLNNYVDRFYPIEPEIKDTTDADRSASYIHLHLELDREGRLRTSLWHRYYITVNQVMVATVTFSKWWLHVYQKEPLFQ